MNYFNLYPLKASLFKALTNMFGALSVQESMIRTELPVLNNTQFYSFDIYNQTSPLSTEVRLDKNDSLFAFAVGLGIYQRDTTLLDQGKQVVQFYPNESYFPPVVGPPAFAPSDLETVYNGKLNIKRGNNIILETFPTRKFRNVGMTQQTSGTNKSSAFAEDQLVPMTCPIQLPGQEQTSINITFPVPSTIAWQAQTANKENRLVLLFDGFLVKGAKNAIDDNLLYEAMGLRSPRK